MGRGDRPKVRWKKARQAAKKARLRARSLLKGQQRKARKA